MRVNDNLKLNSVQTDALSDVQRAMERAQDSGVLFRPLGVELEVPKLGGGVKYELRAAITRETAGYKYDYVLRGAVEDE
jgi:hypothetical protein